MDELEISGKRYISAKRIAKENRYHPDYVGQLIRAGRISGTKVGRAWYVDEASFIEYLGKERGTFVAPIRIEEPSVSQLEPVAVPVQNFSIQSEESKEVFTPGAVEIKNIEEEKIDDLQPTVIVEEPKPIVTKVFIPDAPVAQEKKVAFKTSLTYIPDNSPLFPAIQKRTKPVIAQNNEHKVAKIVSPAQVVIRPKRSLWKTGFATFAVVAVAGIFFSFAFFGSLGINSTVIVEKGKPASVAFAQGKTFCFIFGNCQNGEK